MKPDTRAEKGARFKREAKPASQLHSFQELSDDVLVRWLNLAVRSIYTYDAEYI